MSFSRRWNMIALVILVPSAIMHYMQGHYAMAMFAVAFTALNVLILQGAFDGDSKK